MNEFMNEFMITDYFLKTIGAEITEETTDTRYKRWDDGSAEIEVLEFLYALVRLVKPIHVMETGTYKGWSASYIAKALQDNGIGDITTLEIETRHIQEAKEKWVKAGLGNFIECINIKSLEYEPRQSYELIFLDTELNLRWHEMVRFFPNLEEGGYVVIHDFHRHLYKGSFNKDHPEIIDYPSGPVPDQIKQWIKEDKLRITHFNTPRGLIMLYKVHSGDYKWNEG